MVSSSPPRRVVVWFLVMSAAVSFCPPQRVGSNPRRRTTPTMLAKLSRKQLRLKYPKAGKLSVVLTKDAPPWGAEGDVLRVARGFMLNYLVPNQLAVTASPAVVAEFEAKKAALEAERVAAVEAATALAGTLSAKGKFVIKRKAGAEGKIFGSVLASDVVQVVSAAAGLDLDGKKVTLPPKAIDTVGDFSFAIQLHPEVSVDLVLSIKAIDE